VSSPRKKLLALPERAGRSVLVLAQPSQETDDLLADLMKRRDLHLLRVATVEAAVVALRDLLVSVVIVCSETPGESVGALLRQIDVLRPGIPVLAVRDRKGEESAAWRARGVGILRSPVVPEVLSRTVDVALGLANRIDASQEVVRPPVR
jgi:DNA-binding NtrC family response regulator